MNKCIYHFVGIFFLLFGFVAQAEEITLTTEDGFKLAATIKVPTTMSEKIEQHYPAVILIHQGGSNRGEWEFFHEELLKNGYVILSYDIRGMGASQKDNGKGKMVENIYNAQDQAPLDLKAAIRYLEEMEDVDNTRIAIVGASVGANLAIVGAATMNIKTAVAMSGKTSAVLNLAGKQDVHMRSTFYISSMEADGARAEWAQEMYNNTQEPKEITITPEQSGHGVGIFKNSPFLKEQILTWLSKTL